MKKDSPLRKYIPREDRYRSWIQHEKIGKKISMARSAISLAVPEELGYSEERRIVDRQKKKVIENILNRQALFNDIKHQSTDKSSIQNDKDTLEVPTVMHIKFPVSLIVQGVVSREGHVMRLHFFDEIV